MNLASRRGWGLGCFPMHLAAGVWAGVWAVAWALAATTVPGRAAGSLVVRAPAGYVPGLPVLLRVELWDGAGRPDRTVWDAEATIAPVSAGVTLSTNRVDLRNGLGSTLVSIEGGSGAPVEIVLHCRGLSARQNLTALDAGAALRVGGALPGESTTWSGVVRVTNDVIVPAGHVLTVQPGTWVLLDGVSSGTNGSDLQVNGEIQSLGTPEAPVVMTCASSGLRWGQIRHAGARPSVYRNTIITLAGRGRGEGHTGQTPAVRSSNSQIRFENCSLTDHATPAGTPGKIMQASGSAIVMTNCLLARARMGPEIGSTALQFLDSYIIDMRGPDDADGIYLHSQGAGQEIRLTGSVVAGGDDDGIDTLGANITVQDCIVRGWKFPGDDSKGISVFGGECRVWRSLLVDNTIGLSGKGGDAENVRVRIDRSTILGNSFGVAVTNKSGTLPIIDYRITNSIILGPDAVFTQYDPADIHIDYSLVGESWPGTGNLEGDPGFADASAGDYRLGPGSIAIDAGDPARPQDPDGSMLDLGALTFVPPPPELAGPLVLEPARFGFTLRAYPGRLYVLESSTDGSVWASWTTNFIQTGETRVFDPGTAGVGMKFYRAHLAP